MNQPASNDIGAPITLFFRRTRIRRRTRLAAGLPASRHGFIDLCEELGAALRDPLIRDVALEIVRGLVDRLIVHFNDGVDFAIELIGDIARMVELGSAGTERKKAALDERAACSVKVVAGIGFEPMTFRL